MKNLDHTDLLQGVGRESISVLPPHFQLLRTHTNWRRSWSHIVAGKFSSSSPYSSLLFYSQSDGVGEFYETDGLGQITLLKSHSGWRTSWTQVVPGIFGPSRFSGLLLYDQKAGFGAFYDTDGQGNLIPLSENSGWRNTWTHIVAGHFTNSQFSDLLFYDQSNGFGALYSTDGSGGMMLVAEYSGWRRSWTHIFVRRFRYVGGIVTSDTASGGLSWADTISFSTRAPLGIRKFMRSTITGKSTGLAPKI